MKKLSLIALLGASSLFMFSCKDDEVADSTIGVEFPETFSKKTVEENKAQLEDNGIKMINEMEALKALKGPEAAAQLVSLFSLSAAKNMEGSAGGRIIKSVGNLRTSTKSSSEIFAALRLNEGPSSVQEMFTEQAGTHTWSATTETFDFVAGGDKIIIKFPSAVGASANNAVLTISDYQGKQVQNPVDPQYTGDLPVNLLMNIAVDGTKVLDYSFKADYNASGEPVSLNSVLTLAPFSFEIKLVNDTKKVTADYTLKKGAELLVAMGMGSEGNFTTTNIENSDDPGAVANTAEAYFQVMNIKVSGRVNIKDALAATSAIPAGSSSQERSEKQAEIFNTHYDLVVFYADSKEKIADTEAYSYASISGYDMNGDGVIDGQDDWYSVDMRLIFADGSKSDFETYFESGFDNFFRESEALMGSM